MGCRETSDNDESWDTKDSPDMLNFGFWHLTSKPLKVKDQENILTS